jgi:hypothetical protein
MVILLPHVKKVKDIDHGKKQNYQVLSKGETLTLCRLSCQCLLIPVRM